MKHLNKSPIQPALLFALPVLLILAGLGSCRKMNCHDTAPTIQRFTMEKLDSKVKPFIDEAYEAVPYVVADLCSGRTRLLWLLLKDKATGTPKAHDRIVSAVSRRITSPLGTWAAADGPLPIGDVVGVGLAVGGTAWCCHDLRKASKNLPISQ